MERKNEKGQVLEPCQSSNEEGFWNIKDTAGYLKFRISRVYSLVEQREIPHYRVGRQIRFRKAEIDGWMEEHKGPAVDVKVETRKVIGSLQKRSDPRIKGTIRKIVEEVKEGGYTVGNGKPDQVKGLGKEVSDGTI